MSWISSSRRRVGEWVFNRVFDHYLLRHPLVYGDRQRLLISPSAVLNNALLNLVSGRIEVEDFAFCGHNVSLLTGSHDVRRFGPERLASVPSHGHDIIVRRGAWLGSNSTVIGPAVVGAHSVVAAGAVVTGDVPDYAIVAGVPARIVGMIPHA